MNPFDEAWTLLKMYREPKNQDEIDFNQMIMRNPGGFDRRWCAEPGCNAFVSRGSDYCVVHKEKFEKMVRFPGAGIVSRMASGKAPPPPGGFPKSWQTKLYNFDPDMPSPYGKVRLYHGTSGDNRPSIMSQGLGGENRRTFATGESSVAGVHANRHDGAGAVFGIREAAGFGRPMTTSTGRPWGGAGSTKDPAGYRIFDGPISPSALVDMRGQTAGGAQSSLTSTDRIQGQ